MSSRIAAVVAYDGTDWPGWQTQPGGIAIQDRIEGALQQVAEHKVSTVCAGRTDAGVHAAAQVIHFDTDAQRPLSAWVRGTNAHLPSSIAVQAAIEVPEDFHARFSAVRRAYRYTIHNHPQRHPLQHRQATWVFQTLDVSAMQRAGADLIGEHDFSSFRSSQCQAKSPVRSLEMLRITRTENIITIDVCANAFLHHMVRNLVGALLWVGMGKKSIGWVGEVLNARDRSMGAMTAPAQGLCLAGVDYNEALALPCWSAAWSAKS